MHLAVLEVLATEGGGDVHDARAVVERDVAGGEHAASSRRLIPQQSVLAGFKSGRRLPEGP